MTEILKKEFSRKSFVKGGAMVVGFSLVGAGLGVSVSPAMAVRDEVRAGALQARPLSPALVRRLGLVRRRDKAETPALRVFLAAVADLSENRARAHSPGDAAAARAARRAPR